MRKNNLMIIVAGKQFSGKDTVADILCETFPSLKREALALEIKNEFGRSKDLTMNEIDRNKTMYRSDLMELGNSRRKENPKYWIETVLKGKEGQDLIITDVRLKLEYETFKKMGAITIRLESSREERLKRGHLVREDDITEVDLDDMKEWDYVIENNSDHETLKANAKKVALDIEKKLLAKSK